VVGNPAFSPRYRNFDFLPCYRIHYDLAIFFISYRKVQEKSLKYTTVTLAHKDTKFTQLRKRC